MKKIISVLLCLIVALSFNVSITMTKAEALTLYPEAPLNLIDVDANYYGFELVTEIDTLALYIQEQTVSLAILNKKTPFVIQEAYRTARTNIIFSVADSDEKFNSRCI